MMKSRIVNDRRSQASLSKCPVRTPIGAAIMTAGIIATKMIRST